MIRWLGGWVVRLAVLIIIFLNSSFGIRHSAFASDIPRFYGDEVVVSASRIIQPQSKNPWNTFIIKGTELRNFKNLGEALRVVTGADVTAYGTLGSLHSVRLRGANASQVLMLIDGRRINSPTLGMFDAGDIMVENIERVEVVKAPLSALYGSDAVSGVINIITKSPRGDRKSFFVSTGSFDSQQYKFTWEGGNYLLSGDYLRSAGFRTNGDYLGKNFYGKLRLPILSGEVFADVNYYDAVKGVPGVPTLEADPSSASEPGDRQSDLNILTSAGIKGDNFQLRIYQNTYTQALAPYIWGASTNESWQTGIDWQHSIDIGLGKMLYGLENREDKARTTMSGEHAVNNYAAFIQDEVQLGDRYTLIASLRGDRHSTAGRSINPRVGVVYQPYDGLKLRLSGGTAFRAPTLNELYWNDGWMFGDSNLKPERSTAYEIGLERKLSESTAARVNYFASTTSDQILWDWKSSTTETRAKNVGEVYSEGVEFEWEKKIGESGRAFINYTYQTAVDRKDFDPLAVGKTIRYTPQTKYNAGFFMGSSSVLIKHVGERYADQYNSVKLPAYTVVDFKYSKKVGSLGLQLSIDNLLDEKYSEAVGTYFDPATFASEPRNYPMPGRRYSIGVQWEI
jgi:outer membrane cobalamin receptor